MNPVARLALRRHAAYPDSGSSTDRGGAGDRPSCRVKAGRAIAERVVRRSWDRRAARHWSRIMRFLLSEIVGGL
jgi:hypothetical protein